MFLTIFFGFVAAWFFSGSIFGLKNTNEMEGDPCFKKIFKSSEILTLFFVDFLSDWVHLFRVKPTSPFSVPVSTTHLKSFWLN